MDKFSLWVAIAGCAAASGAAHADTGAAMGIPPGLGAVLWLPVLALTLGCAVWLLGLILAQRKTYTRKHQHFIAMALRGSRHQLPASRLRELGKNGPVRI